jgi:mersacidin/lichenicidin family type 2 lantibiotic
MSRLDIIRAWKDEEYCSSLSAEQRTLLPENPVGLIELTDLDLRGAEGGTISTPMGCPSVITICSFDICSITITITATFAGIE